MQSLGSSARSLLRRLVPPAQRKALRGLVSTAPTAKKQGGAKRPGPGKKQAQPERSAGPRFTPDQSDIMLTSYPKSGNTWTRFLIANLLAGEEPVGFDTIESWIPDIYKSPLSHIRSLPPPRVIKSHQPVTDSYGRVIYLVRDPRDVIPSFHRHLKRRGDLRGELSLDEFALRFIGDEAGQDMYGSWADHVRGWITRSGQDFFLLRYEDLLADPSGHLTRIADFCGISASPEAIERAVARSSADSLRALEQAAGGTVGSRAKNQGTIPFIGTASAGQGSKVLSPEVRLTVEQSLASVMQEFGYLT